MSMKALTVEADQLMAIVPGPVDLSLPQYVDDNIIKEILIDWGEALTRLEKMALQIEMDPDDSNSLDEIKRTLHTLKGDSAVFGLSELSDVFHQVEDLLRSRTEASSWKTLIVEDDFAGRLLLQELLQPYGLSHIAVNGREAVEAVRIALEADEPYDLICPDIMMPEMDGQEALRNIRAQEEAKGIISGGKGRDGHGIGRSVECEHSIQQPVRRLPGQTHRKGQVAGSAPQAGVDLMTRRISPCAS